MPYLWTDQETIQSYLDVEGSIRIRTDDEAQADDLVNNFSRASAQTLENESVYEIATLISLVFEPTDADAGTYSDQPLGFDTSSAPNYLKLLVARLAASKIATIRLGANLSTLPNWVRAYKNEVYAQLQRMAINAETVAFTGLRIRDFDLGEVLIKMKTREHTAEELDD